MLFEDNELHLGFSVGREWKSLIENRFEDIRESRLSSWKFSVNILMAFPSSKKGLEPFRSSKLEPVRRGRIWSEPAK